MHHCPKNIKKHPQEENKYLKFFFAFSGEELF